MKWQTLYVHLRAAGVPVTGDKARYGSATDRLASFAEGLFSGDVPDAVDSNASQYQASIDFTINGWSIDVKAATPSNDLERWAFCINKQKDIADFFVLYAFGDQHSKEVRHVLLLPREIATAKTTISLPVTMKSKWADYELPRSELAGFFAELGHKGH